MNDIFSPTECVIDTGAIQRNFIRLGSPEQIMPVIKSDAYGHGFIQTAKALHDAGARHFAVGMIQEGELLRKNGFHQDILSLMGCTMQKDWRICAIEQITPLLHSFEDLKNIAACGTETISVALKVNTGMNRLGFQMEDISCLIEWLRANPHIKPVYCVSHLACADSPEKEAFTAAQVKMFNQFFYILKQEFPEIIPSLGNSAMSMRMESHGMLRPGLAIYGGNPFEDSTLDHHNIKLEWAMSLHSKVLAFHKIKKGQTVSYGATFTAQTDMTIAVVGIGYSQGYPRQLSGKSYAMINGRQARQIGRICMGMTMFDASNIPNVHIGDDVCLAGRSENNIQININWLAKQANTIPYELLCTFGTMNKRLYINSK